MTRRATPVRRPFADVAWIRRRRLPRHAAVVALIPATLMLLALVPGTSSHPHGMVSFPREGLAAHSPASATSLGPSASLVLSPTGHVDLRTAAELPRATSAPPIQRPSTGFPHVGTSVSAAAAPIFSLVLANSTQSSPLTVSATAEGVNSSNCGCSPPDIQVGAGPTQELEMVNTAGLLFDATGQLTQSVSSSTLFGTGGDFLSDPKVIYDNLSGRWFASTLGCSTTVCFAGLAVSATSNASGNWTDYQIDAPSGTLGDQPILGLGSTTVGIASDIFTSSTFHGSALWVLNKSQLLAGAKVSSVRFGPSTMDYELHPVQSISTSPDLWVAMTSYAMSTSYIQLEQVAGVPPANVTIGESNLTVGSISPGPSAAQPTTSTVLDVGDARVETAVWNAGLLWLDFSDACTPSGDSAARTCVRLVEINTSNLTVTQDFNVARRGTYLYYPALALRPDDALGLILGVSSSSIYPSDVVTGRLPTTAAGTLEVAAWLVNGTTAQSCGSAACRYGDYFGAAAVPNSTRLWVAGEYVTAAQVWQSRIGQVSGLGPMTLTLTAQPSSVDVGQPTVVTLEIHNSSCVGAGALFCSVNLPLGGSTYSATCANPVSTIHAPTTFSSPGTYTLGTGGSVDVYSSSTCSSAALVGSLPIPTTTVVVSPAPSVSVGATPAGSADVGQSIRFQAAVTGGLLPLSYHWSALPTGCVDSLAAAVSCRPTTPGLTTPKVSVTDANGDLVNATTVYSIDPQPQVALTVIHPTVEVGQFLDLTGVATYGSGTFNFSWANLPPGCPNLNDSVLSCRPLVTGAFLVNMTATDTNGFAVTSNTVAVLVLKAAAVSVAPASSTVDVGGTVTFTATVAGGLAPFTYDWTNLPPGCSSANVSALSCSPSGSGRFAVTVTVVDELGDSNASSASLVVSASSTSGLGLLASNNALLLIAVIVMAAGILALIGAARWHRSLAERRRPKVQRPRPPARGSA